MTTTHLSPAAKAAQDAARQGNGRFGEQAKSEPGFLDLTQQAGVPAGHCLEIPGVAYSAAAADASFTVAGAQVSERQASERDWAGVSISAGGVTFVVPTRTQVGTGHPDPGPYHQGSDGDRVQSGYRPLTHIAKDIRADLKAAVAVGWLPDNLQYSVTTRHGTSIELVAKGLRDEHRVDPRKVAAGDLRNTDRDEVIELTRRLSRIRSRHNRDRSDIQTDYFDVTYYGVARIETDSEADFWAREKARLARQRVARR